jgi:hypothetical protein
LLVLVVVALLVPGLLIGLMLAMEHVEQRLGRGLLTDQVEWMLRSELPAEQVEDSVAERLVQPLASTTGPRRS